MNIQKLSSDQIETILAPIDDIEVQEGVMDLIDKHNQIIEEVMILEVNGKLSEDQKTNLQNYLQSQSDHLTKEKYFPAAEYDQQRNQTIKILQQYLNKDLLNKLLPQDE